MLDGYTSVAWKNAFGETTHATLPTLNELRTHLLATDRDDLSWKTWPTCATAMQRDTWLPARRRAVPARR